MGSNKKVFEEFTLKTSSICPQLETSSFCIFSSEPRSVLNNIKFDGYIFAENGLLFRPKYENPEFWTITEMNSVCLPILNWSEQLLNILKYYSQRVPNSNIEVSEVKRFFYISI